MEDYVKRLQDQSSRFEKELEECDELLKDSDHTLGRQMELVQKSLEKENSDNFCVTLSLPKIYRACLMAF